MGTKFNEVIDFIAIPQDDFRLRRVKEENPNGYIEMMSVFIIRGIPYFSDDCLQSLTYDQSTKEFDAELTNKEKQIVADLGLYVWYLKNLNDTKKFEEPVTDANFKRNSAGSIMRVRQDYVDKMREKYKQDIEDYKLGHYKRKGNYVGGLL